MRGRWAARNEQMKSKKWLALVLFGSLVFGGIAGGIIGGYASAKLMGESRLVAMMNRYAVDTKIVVFLLYDIRKGEIHQAMNLLEMKLDDNIVTLSEVKTLQFEDGGAIVNAALKAAKKYRTEYPRPSSNSEIDKIVEQTLSQIDEERPTKLSPTRQWS